MDTMEQFAATGHASAHAARIALGRPLATVVLAAALVPAAVATLLSAFAQPELSPMLAPVVRQLGGEPALHYPGTLWALPAMLARTGALAGWLLLPLAAGWAATLAAYGRGGVSAVAGLLGVLQRLPRWLAAGVPLVLAHDATVAMQAKALAALAHRPVGAFGEFVVALAADAAVLALGAIVLPELADRDVRLRTIPGHVRAALSYGGPGIVAFGAVFAVLGVVCRFAAERVAHVITGPRPDAAPLVVAAWAVVAALGLVTFAGGSVVLAAALDDRWK